MLNLIQYGPNPLRRSLKVSGGVCIAMHRARMLLGVGGCIYAHIMSIAPSVSRELPWRAPRVPLECPTSAPRVPIECPASAPRVPRE